MLQRAVRRLLFLSFACALTLVSTNGTALAAEPVPPPCTVFELSRDDCSVSDALNHSLESVNGVLERLLFFSVTGDLVQVGAFDAAGQPVLDEQGNQKQVPVGFPFIVFVLVAGGIFFSLFHRFINLRAFTHAIDIVRGKFDRPEDEGEISHFRAFTSALSATIGLGNIAGVAIAIQIGGPGAMLWMLVAAFFGMSLKFNSCTLSQMYRRRNADGSVSGGPMYYLDLGLRQFEEGRFGRWARTGGKTLGIMYALMIMGGSFGGGNMFQANQSFGAVQEAFGVGQGFRHAFGIVLAALVALVILGGIQRIGAATSKIVPVMVAVYVLASLYVLLTNAAQIPNAVGLIFEMAFTKNAIYGGTLGVIVKGFQRASFSNEAGIGSAAVAHAAAKTDEPVREGMVAMLGPFVDTMVVCSMTAIVVIITGAWNDPDLVGKEGVQLTAAAFRTELSWFPLVLTVSVLLFAYSTMISWAYYGERGWIYLLDHFTEGLGQRTLSVYRLLFVGFVYVGTVSQLTHVLTFSDLMILCMALPNVVGSLVLAPIVRRRVQDYWRRYKSGSFTPQAIAKSTSR